MLKKGLNLFFVRDDVLQQNDLIFKEMNNVEKLYRRPAFSEGLDGSNPQPPKNQEYVTSSD